MSDTIRYESLTLNNYRKTMASDLGESLRMIQELLSDADFEDAFPHVFGHPDELGAEAHIRNECGLLLRKAQLHIVAVLRSNESNNLHSMAVQMRVVLECAVQVVSKANAACKGTRKELKKALNVSEHDYREALVNLSRGRIDAKEISEAIISARAGIGETGTNPPKKVNQTDKIGALPGGAEWYRHLSKFFGHSDAQALTGISYFGGVMSNTTEVDEMAFAAFLDHLTRQVNLMLVGYGFLLIAVNGNEKPFEVALNLSDRNRSSSKSFQKAVHQRAEPQ